MREELSPAPHNIELSEVLHQIRLQLIEKIRARYDISAEEAERRLRAMEEER